VTAQDFDVATDALPGDVVRLFPRVIPTGMHARHGHRAGWATNKVEVTTFRGEGPYEAPAAGPSTVTFPRRRRRRPLTADFTVNAIAWDPIAGVLRDPFHGVEDLAPLPAAARWATPRVRFRDGRIAPPAWRFARLHAPAGDLEPGTRRAVTETLDVFAKCVDGEGARGAGEAARARRACPAAGSRLMLRTGLLGPRHPRAAGVGSRLRAEPRTTAGTSGGIRSAPSTRRRPT